jgi:CheY-like chemotaxis protein
MSPCRILNVGPDPAVQGLLRELVQSGDPVLLQHVETGSLALDELLGLPGTELPNIIIIAFRLPILTGLDFILAMRAQERLRDIPIVVWGSEIRAYEIDQMHEAGAVCVFLGEFDRVHLNAVRRYLGLAGSTAGETASAPVQRKESSRRGRVKTARADRDAQLGTMFTWAGCLPAVLWLIAFLGGSYRTVDVAPLAVYAGLTCAGLVLMGSRPGKTEAAG